MKDERLKVLEMVEDGKINVEEATKLLEALKATDTDYSSSSDFHDKVKEFSQNVECFAKDVGEKMGDAFKVMEPKIKKATKVVVEKTACLVDEIARALNESLKNMEECGQNSCDEANCDCDCGCQDEQRDNGEKPEE